MSNENCNVKNNESILEKSVANHFKEMFKCSEDLGYLENMFNA